MEKVEEVSNKVNSLDLSKVLKRTQEDNEWPEDRLLKAERSYRRYLTLVALSERSICPSPDVDEVWHNHILHTKLYVDDCDNVFGKYVHHTPFPRMEGPMPKPHRNMIEYTISLYEKFFGEEAVLEAGYVIDTTRCRGQCKDKCRSDCCQGLGC